MADICRRLLISGRVQGVCFRHYTRETALKTGVKGWVRNRSDGQVEALIEGEEQAVGLTLSWCRKGPKLARVDAIEITELPATDEFTEFQIL